jgi:hypothetical protein
MEKIIDLFDIIRNSNPNPSEVYTQSYSKDYLIKEMIIKSIRENKEDYNTIILPISILNIIEKSVSFLPKSKISELDTHYFVGELFNMKVLIDVSILSNMVILSYDKQTKREMKLKSIIENKSIKEDLELNFIF